MKVSIVTPSYNQAQFIEQTIQSVLGQEFPDLEYLIVDGGSTDGSLDIIQKYENQLTWWVSEPDNGQAEAINKGFTRCSGEVVAWLNSDDVYAPGAIKAAVQFLSENPEIGMVYGNAVSFDQDGHPLNDMKFADWGLAGLVAFNIICQPAVFLRRSVLEQAGYLDDTYHMMLDHQLWLRVAQITQIRHVPQVWAFARHHADAKNVSQAPKFGEEAYNVLAWMRNQPNLAKIITQNESQVMAMVHRFNGRYVLDGGLPWDALKSYFRSFRVNPKIALQEWHRILFAVLSLFGFRKLGDLYYQMKKQNLPESVRTLGIENINELYKKLTL